MFRLDSLRIYLYRRDDNQASSDTGPCDQSHKTSEAIIALAFLTVEVLIYKIIIAVQITHTIIVIIKSPLIPLFQRGKTGI